MKYLSSESLTMVNANELSQIPLRQGNNDACLLSSYGAALYPFTHTPEIKYFVDCCILLGINYVTEGDCISLFRPQLVDQRIGSIKKGTGYDWLEELHNNCSGSSFKKAHSSVIIERGLGKIKAESKLKNTRSTAIFALSFGKFPGKAHSICVIYDTNLGFIARDSGRLISQPFSLIDACGNNLEELIFNLYGKEAGPKIGESILFTLINN